MSEDTAVGPLTAAAINDVLDLDELPHVIVRGNLTEGYDIIGPFNGWDSAVYYDQTFILYEPTWIMPLVEPAAHE